MSKTNRSNYSKGNREGKLYLAPVGRDRLGHTLYKVCDRKHKPSKTVR
jgi:hypothetical protein